MKDSFPGNSYSTPEGRPRALSEFLLFGSRWSVYLHFFGTVLRSSSMARRGIYDDEAWANSSLEIINSLERCGARFLIEGMDKIRATVGPVVFASNHMSTLETVVLPGLVRPMKPVTYVVKKQLVTGVVWGPIMRSRNPIAVSRKDPRGDLEIVLREGHERLASGISVIVFPQGTRTEVWKRSGFNSLGVKLAAKAGVPLVPVALKTDFWGSSGIFRGFGPVRRDRTIHIEFGEPLSVSGRGKAEHEACLDFIEGRLRAWGASIE